MVAHENERLKISNLELITWKAFLLCDLGVSKQRYVNRSKYGHELSVKAPNATQDLPMFCI